VRSKFLLGFADSTQPTRSAIALRKLEHNGLVKRKVYPAVPPQVEYSLTPLGETLAELLSLLTE
jgi:DNA-binding HxlR family transcriptional regulator